MNQRDPFPADDAGLHVMFIGPSSGPQRSILDDLLPLERDRLNAWAADQPGDAHRGGAVDLMAWPGWAEVAKRKAGIVMVDEGSLVLQDAGFSPEAQARKFNPGAVGMRKLDPNAP